MTGGYSTTAIAYKDKAASQSENAANERQSRLDVLIANLDQKLLIAEFTLDRLTDRTAKLTGQSAWNRMPDGVSGEQPEAVPSSLDTIYNQSERLQRIIDRMNAVDAILGDNI